jgi:Pyridoxamine 5'-phosphate oxidase
MPPRVERPLMEEYGVTADLAGALPWQWARERLEQTKNFWIVTSTLNGRPHAMPAWGVWMDDRQELFFSCAPSSRKNRNLLSNPRVSVAVDSTEEVVSLEGVARRCASSDEAGDGRTCATRWAQKYEPDETKREQSIAFAQQNAMWIVTPERAFGIIEREAEFSSSATRWVW